MGEGGENLGTPEVHKALLSLVKISFLGATVEKNGTGLVMPGNEIYTADHLVRPTGAILTYTPKRLSDLLRQPVTEDLAHDFAVYKLPDSLKGKIPPLTTTTTLPKDGNVFMVGFPGYSQGDEAGWDLPVIIACKTTYNKGPALLLSTRNTPASPQVYQGLSGGAVVTPEGKAVAFVSHMIMKDFLAIKLSEVHGR